MKYENTYHGWLMSPFYPFLVPKSIWPLFLRLKTLPGLLNSYLRYQQYRDPDFRSIQISSKLVLAVIFGEWLIHVDARSWNRYYLLELMGKWEYVPESSESRQHSEAWSRWSGRICLFERKMPLTLYAMYDLATLLPETEHLLTSVWFDTLCQIKMRDSRVLPP